MTSWGDVRDDLRECPRFRGRRTKRFRRDRGEGETRTPSRGAPTTLIPRTRSTRRRPSPARCSARAPRATSSSSSESASSPWRASRSASSIAAALGGARAALHRLACRRSRPEGSASRTPPPRSSGRLLPTGPRSPPPPLPSNSKAQANTMSLTVSRGRSSRQRAPAPGTAIDAKSVLSGSDDRNAATPSCAAAGLPSARRGRDARGHVARATRRFLFFVLERRGAREAAFRVLVVSTRRGRRSGGALGSVES